ncbi:cysteine desulfurase family protein [Streptococcus massiliensis]|uniref:cysteine desulfurase n=1 Tax=Streptococcus massiliensis TaxID=313439 RepID=A0A380KW74_9STRE|nr:cysteine desulfurase family protein [Streptococcus massiliensis]SUN75998.1 putative aminotransferase [Streptococcus massiliensis]
MTYFDNAATTPMSAAAISAMTTILAETFGNPSSTHTYGRSASKILRESRQTIAQLLKVKENQIIFTSGGTESNNTAIKGYALAHQNKGKHLITTAIEHHSVSRVVEDLVENYGFKTTILSPEDGQITAQQVKRALRPDTILVSTMFANNETGYVLPISEIGQVLKEHPAAYHVDAVQALGKIPIFPEELGIDFLSASAHKFHGPKGIGFLYARNNDFHKYLLGGDQEDKRRAGTENLAAIAGMAAALAEDYEKLDQNYKYVSKLKEQFLSELTIDYYLNEGEISLPYVVNIGFPKQANDLLLLRLDLEGIAVSTGSACTAGAVEPSHVLQAFYGDDSPRLKESIRVSFSPFNTPEEITQLTTKINQIIGG